MLHYHQYVGRRHFYGNLYGLVVLEIIIWAAILEKSFEI